jgi:uracil-DNA glycosylase family protein
MATQIQCETPWTAVPFLPEKLSLPQLRNAAATCRGCDLYCNATQTVFGEGPGTASVIFVGEQPGDQEDKAGKPFVGPSGGLLDKALHEVGIDRSEVYVTNAVKHFKFEPRGKKRIHSKPNSREIEACRPWLEAEIATVRPKLIVCLGATASQALMGKEFRITKDHGRVFRETEWAPAVVATNHPSALLRVPDAEARHRAYAQFIDDLRVVRSEMARITREQADASAERKKVQVRREMHPGTEDRAGAAAQKSQPNGRPAAKPRRRSKAGRQVE